MAWTTADEAWLTELYAARSAILAAKSYSIAGRVRTMADERWITDQIQIYESKKKTGGVRVAYAPVFVSTR